MTKAHAKKLLDEHTQYYETRLQEKDAAITVQQRIIEQYKAELDQFKEELAKCTKRCEELKLERNKLLDRKHAIDSRFMALRHCLIGIAQIADSTKFV